MKHPTHEDGQIDHLAIGVGIVMILTILGVMIAAPCLVRARNTSSQNACVNNLRIIDSGKEQAAMAYRLTDGDSITSVTVNEYAKGNTTPLCPQGGSITTGKLEGVPHVP